MKPHPTDTAKGCRGAARDILVVALAGHNTLKSATASVSFYTNNSEMPNFGL
jgi:hypothetical protein